MAEDLAMSMMDVRDRPVTGVLDDDRAPCHFFDLSDMGKSTMSMNETIRPRFRVQIS